MATDPERVKALFLAAIERGDLAGRRAFLDAEAGGDAELRDRLDALLAAYDRPPGALDRPLAAHPDATDALDVTGSVSSPPPGTSPDDGVTLSRTDDDGPSLVDTIIADRYKIRQEIGEGGMGTVFLAEQLRPVRRQVALKLIKRGMDSRQVLARFESERQALALMEHPHIARVLDAGTTADGRPFFVMELVKGIPITEYCDAHRLDLNARLELFRQVCSAVQHAHQKGIIHRDLKPSNILVEAHDDKPVPKVIDFGLAKATSGLRLTEQSLFTAFGSVAGTPLYMAPEQASFNALDIDTRADIYSLGVILYELLTGTTPIARESIRRAAIDEMLRVIREVEPPTPSSRISTSESLPTLAANRHVEPERLRRLIRGDLDWIAMKALAKERERRYASAVGLADDVARYLHHEPVSAGPPGVAYRTRKFVRRNRGAVIAAALVLLALACGGAGTMVGLLKAIHQEKIAESRRADAERRLAQRDQANAILLSVFNDLNARGEQEGAEGATLSERLGRRLGVATAALEGDATGDPLDVARLQLALGRAQAALGNQDQAIALYEKASAGLAARLGPDHRETLGARSDLGDCVREAGDFGRAIEMLEDVMARTRVRVGPDHPDTAAVINNLALAYYDAGRRDRALNLLQQAVDLSKARNGPEHVTTLQLTANLAASHLAAGQNDRAMGLYEQVLPIMRARLGPDHALTLDTLNNLAMIHSRNDRPDRTIPLLEEALRLSRPRLGQRHPATALYMANLSDAYMKMGQIERALALAEPALEIFEARLGPDHPDSLRSMSNISQIYIALGQNDRAIAILEECLAWRKARRGPDHPDTIGSMQRLATAYWFADRPDRSIPLFEELLPRMIAQHGPDHPETWINKTNLGVNYKDAGRLAEAVPLLEAAYRARKAHPRLRWAGEPLAEAYLDQGQIDKAVPLARELLAEGRAAVPPLSPDLADVLSACVKVFIKVKDWDAAEPLAREAFAVREAIERDGWKTFRQESMLGEVLTGARKYAEAEKRLRSGYEGLKAHVDGIPPRGRPAVGKALDRLIALAEATGKAAEATAWKAERARLATGGSKP